MKYWIVILITLFALDASAQKKKSKKNRFENCYSSIEEALLVKDSVSCLDLTKQKLRTFPEEIIEFVNLKVLILSKNRIDSIPPSIAALTKLEVLIVFENDIRDMSFLSLLPQLKEADLSDNFIEEIPESIQLCTSLENLNLSMNLMANVSSELGYLDKLTVLDLTENEMTRDEQDYIKNLLPDTHVLLSPPCFCKFND